MAYINLWVVVCDFSFQSGGDIIMAKCTIPPG